MRPYSPSSGQGKGPGEALLSSLRRSDSSNGPPLLIAAPGAQVGVQRSKPVAVAAGASAAHAADNAKASADNANRPTSPTETDPGYRPSGTVHRAGTRVPCAWDPPESADEGALHVLVIVVVRQQRSRCSSGMMDCP